MFLDGSCQETYLNVGPGGHAKPPGGGRRWFASDAAPGWRATMRFQSPVWPSLVAGSEASSCAVAPTLLPFRSLLSPAQPFSLPLTCLENSSICPEHALCAEQQKAQCLNFPSLISASAHWARAPSHACPSRQLGLLTGHRHALTSALLSVFSKAFLIKTTESQKLETIAKKARTRWPERATFNFVFKYIAVCIFFF